MTFKEKLKKDYPMLEVENATQNSCPCDYEYEEKPSSPECEISECEDCWNREIPTDKTEESLKILEAHKKAYESGLNDAWELARRVADMTHGTRNVILGTNNSNNGVHDILCDFTPQEALAKLKAYEEAKSKVVVGDVVEIPIGTKCVVTAVRENMADGFTEVGYSFYDLPIGELRKTGKHIDISSILEQIGE